MFTDPRQQPEVSPRRLWFGFVATAIAWASAGCLDVIIAWRACTHQEDFGIPPEHSYARILAGLLALALLLISVVSGIISYRNWKRLSASKAFLDAQAVERREFLAVLGVIITVTLGMGIVWLALPPIFIDFCWRAR
ncbi:MAG TPA: hypothetical protein VMU48_10590 [Terracidiphilus sp.]|nr:hypothetical protein [Terracidiphilus sp.]